MIESNRQFELVVTLNPNDLENGILRQFMEAGVTIFRMNGSFLDASEAKEMVSTIRRECGERVKILLDLPGFKPRFSNIEKEIRYTAGVPLSMNLKSFNYPDILTHMQRGDFIRIKDGMVRLEIEAVNAKEVVLIPDNSGVLRRGKGFYLEKRGYRPSTSVLSQADIDLIDLAKKIGIDYVGVSFVHDLKDMEQVRSLLDGRTAMIPKIESRESLERQNLLSILKNCDKVIVDRGDMSGEAGLENIWQNQRRILDLARVCGCQVIMATQFFTHMLQSPLPSIAEIDSFYDLLHLGIEGIQVSEETSVGNHGLEVVRMIRKGVEDVQRFSNENSGERGRVVWLLGPTSSGKTTLGKRLVEHFGRSRVPVIHLDGDEIRNLFGPNLPFDPESRLLVVKALTHHANKAARAGYNVIVSALTAGEDAREYILKSIENLTVVYLDCPIDECAVRDERGLYAKASKGEIDTLIGFNSPYQIPRHFDIRIDTGSCSQEESLQALLAALLEENRIRLWGDAGGVGI